MMALGLYSSVSAVNSSQGLTKAMLLWLSRARREITRHLK